MIHTIQENAPQQAKKHKRKKGDSEEETERTKVAKDTKKTPLITSNIEEETRQNKAKDKGKTSHKSKKRKSKHKQQLPLSLFKISVQEIDAEVEKFTSLNLEVEEERVTAVDWLCRENFNWIFYKNRTHVRQSPTPCAPIWYNY